MGQSPQARALQNLKSVRVLNDDTGSDSALSLGETKGKQAATPRTTTGPNEGEHLAPVPTLGWNRGVLPARPLHREPTPPVTAKQERFVAEYLIDLNATRAYKSVYKCADKVAAANGSRLLTNAEIVAAVVKGQEKAIERTEITQDWVLNRLVENVERSMQIKAVLDSHGRETGEYVYQGNVANGALTLLGKQLGMFKDQVEHSGDITLTASEREQQIVGILTTARKRQKELVS